MKKINFKKKRLENNIICWRILQSIRYSLVAGSNFYKLAHRMREGKRGKRRENELNPMARASSTHIGAPGQLRPTADLTHTLMG